MADDKKPPKKAGEVLIDVDAPPQVLIVIRQPEKTSDTLVSLETEPGVWIETSSLLRRIASGPNAPSGVL